METSQLASIFAMMWFIAGMLKTDAGPGLFYAMAAASFFLAGISRFSGG